MRILLVCLLHVAFSQLAAECEEGDYEVTGHDTGKAVELNYTSSMVHKMNDKTYLTLDFIVPTQYFYQEQNVSGIIYDRSVQISFHDRTSGAPGIYDACYSLRTGNGSEWCPEVRQNWTSVPVSTDECSTVLSGTLPWDEMMRFGYHDPDRIDFQDGNRTVNGFETPTWEVYMMAIIETWAGFEETSEVVNDQYPDMLTINTERYSYYEIPFRISFPKQITLVAPPIRVAAPMVTLYAVVEQEIVNINFNPTNGEGFGEVELTIVTQTQYPFALRNFTDPDGAAIIRTISGDIDGDPVWISSDNPETCTSVDGSADNYLCEQEWRIVITPNLCDVSGEYQMEMWAICFTDVDGCALDMDLGQQTSNAWTGYMDFTVEAQNFCPQVIDEILVEGTINKFIDNTYETVAEPGVNVFSNDHVWFEVVYTTKSAKSGLTFAEGDDSLIEFVRPYSIVMGVSMNTAPLQTEVVRSNGDVTGTTLDYEVTLCTATPQTYDYTDDFVDDCFDTANIGWNAQTYLDFAESINNVGPNTIDANEIGFQMRLDERVIPVDIPNDQAIITIMVDSEVYYYGNDNPSNRRAMFEVRRFLSDPQSRSQRTEVIDIFSMPSAADQFTNEMNFCGFSSDGFESATFVLEMEMDSLDMPTEHTVDSQVIAVKYGLMSYFHTDLSALEVTKVETCVSHGSKDKCTTMWELGRRQLGEAGKYSFVRYYIKINDYNTAYTFQDELTHYGAIYQQEFFESKIVRSLSVDLCDDSIDTPTGSNDADGGWTIEEENAATSLFALFALCFGFLML